MRRLLSHRPASSSRGQCLRYQAGLGPAGARAGDFAGQIAAALSRGEIELNCPLATVSDIGEYSAKDTVGLHTTVTCLFSKVCQVGFSNKSLCIRSGWWGLASQGIWNQFNSTGHQVSQVSGCMLESKRE